MRIYNYPNTHTHMCKNCGMYYEPNEDQIRNNDYCSLYCLNEYKRESPKVFPNDQSYNNWVDYWRTSKN